MNCAEVERERSAYLYGELAASERRLLEQHLLACVACRQRVDADRTSMRLLDVWPPTELADDDRLAELLDRATATQVTREAARRRRRNVSRTWWPIAAGAAAAVVLFGLLTFVGANASFNDGTLTLAFGRTAHMPRGPVPSGASTATAPTTVQSLKLRPLVSDVAAAHVEERLERFAAALDEVFEELDRRQEQRLLTVARSLDERRAATVESLDRRLTEVGTRIYEETRRNRAALEGAIRFANLPPETHGKDERR